MTDSQQESIKASYIDIKESNHCKFVINDDAGSVSQNLMSQLIKGRADPRFWPPNKHSRDEYIILFVSNI